MTYLLEGIRDLTQPCSLSLVLPGLLLYLSARTRRSVVLATLLLSIWVGGWLKAVGWLPGAPSGAGRVLVGLALIGAGWMAFQLRSEISGAVAAVAAGGIAAWLWMPCVGPALGDILNSAPQSPASEVVPMGLFVLGLSVPVLVAALLPAVLPAAPRRWEELLAVVAFVGVVVIGGAIVLGWYDDVVIQLNRWSVPAQ